jgi:hypothetical protein
MWKEYILYTARKGLTALDVLVRIVTSTWGLLARNTKLLYTAVVRLIILYGTYK